MATTITISNLVDDQSICLPYEVTGTVTPDSGIAILAGAKQIDDGDCYDIGEQCDPDLPAANDEQVSFSVLLTKTDCPFVDEFYMLTLLFWDSGAEPSLTQANVTFRVNTSAQC